MAVFDATIKDYLAEIDETPLLSWEEECELAQLVAEYNDPMARDRLVRSNLRLVVSIAKKFKSPNLPLADIIEEGNLGLIRAIDSFDTSHGVRFSTYAAWWIRQSIKRALLLDSGPISVPTYMIELISQYRRTLSDLQTNLSKPPTLEKIAKEMKLPVKKVKAIKKIAETAKSSLDSESNDSENGFEQDSQIEHSLPEDKLANYEEIGKLLNMLTRLDKRQADILTLRFGIGGKEPLTLKQIGAKLKLTRERVRQLQAEALKSLNELMTEI